MTLGGRLAELRDEAGLKQKDVADKINVVRSTISGYEKGTSQPSYAVLLQLADIYHVSLDYLFGRTKIKTDLKSLEGQLKTRNGLIPIDRLFALDALDKEIIGLMLQSLMEKEKYKNK